MKHLSRKYDLEFQDEGYRLIAGVDEAGRGPWAGPVVAACLVFDEKIKPIVALNDSKLMTHRTREEAYEWLTANFKYGVGVVAQEIIDEINILQATKLAMKQAIESLEVKPDLLLIDALKLSNVNIPQRGIIKADSKIWCVAAASIIAKVTRDRLMFYYHKKYPEYGFDRHKGYGTKIHQEALKKNGICPLHRKSFRPIKEILMATK
jgi:ribonuclease HII